MRGMLQMSKHRTSTKIADVIMTEAAQEKREKRHAERMKETNDLYRDRNRSHPVVATDGN